MILLDVDAVGASRPLRPLFDNVSLTLSDGDRVGVVGLNGCGKSTLLRMIARELTPEAGEVRWGKAITVGFLPQHPELPFGTVGDAVCHGWRGEAMLDRLGMAGLVSSSTAELSGGQAKRVALAALLVSDHDVLVLDEPTNHLDLAAIRFLERWLAEFRGGLIVVTHDRHVLDAVTTRVLELDRGRGYVHTPEGRHAGSGYAAYLAGRAQREAAAETAERVRRNLAERELAWLRRGAPARTSKPKSRIAAATAIVNGRAEPAARSGELGLSLGTRRLGNKGIELTDVSFEWTPVAPVLRGCSVTFEPGDRIGIVGPNGVGKSTLLDLIVGVKQPTAGVVSRGSTVVVGYYDQIGRQLDMTQRVRDAVAGNKGEPSVDDLGLMRRFWFDGDAQFAPIGTLSGGERRRLQLLLTLIEQPNVLLLDEPTNDLDLDTLRALEDFLDDWPGIVVAVSHDRSFVDRVTDEVLAIDPGGTARWIRGGVASWLAEVDAAGPLPGAGRGSEPGSGPGIRADSRIEASSGAPATGPKARSASTIRRMIATAERELESRLARRDDVVRRITGVTEHVELTELGDELSVAQQAVDTAELTWLELAAEAERGGIVL